MNHASETFLNDNCRLRLLLEDFRIVQTFSVVSVNYSQLL